MTKIINNVQMMAPVMECRTHLIIGEVGHNFVGIPDTINLLVHTLFCQITSTVIS